MSSAQVHIKPVLLVEEFRSCCVLQNQFCIDLFASSFTSTSTILNSHRAITLFFILNNRTQQTQGDNVKYPCVPKGGDIGFPNTVIQLDPSASLLSSLAVRVPLCLYFAFSPHLASKSYNIYIVLHARVHGLRRGNQEKVLMHLILSALGSTV